MDGFSSNVEGSHTSCTCEEARFPKIVGNGTDEVRFSSTSCSTYNHVKWFWLLMFCELLMVRDDGVVSYELLSVEC